MDTVPKDDAASFRRNRIVTVSEDGLSVEIEGSRHFAPWRAVRLVSGTASRADNNLLVLAFEIEGVGGPRTLLVTEDEPLWAELMKVLHVGLPIAPLEAWAAGMAASPGVYTLYARADGVGFEGF